MFMNSKKQKLDMKTVQLHAKGSTNVESDSSLKSNPSSVFLNLPSEVEGELSLGTVKPLQLDILRIALSVIVSFLLALIPLIAIRWSIPLRRFLFFNILPLEAIFKATHFLIKYTDSTIEIVKAFELEPQTNTVFAKNKSIGFQTRKVNYVFNQSKKMFQALEITLFKDNSIDAILKQYQITSNNQKVIEGLTNDEANKRLKLFGKCIIDIEFKSIVVYMFEEMTAPLYFVQYIAVTVWLLQEYYIFAFLVIGFTNVISIMNYLFYRSGMLKLREKAHNFSNVISILIFTLFKVTVYRDNNQQNIELQTLPDNFNIDHQQFLYKQQVKITSDQLVPGDLILLEENLTLPCDCILLAGEVFVNEVTLTGESVPVPKYELNTTDEYYNMDQKCNTKSLLFDGTILIKLKPSSRTQNQCLAVVVRTGYSSFKGQIFRSLVYTKSSTPIFQKTGVIFIVILATGGLLSCMIILFQFIETGVNTGLIVLKVAHQMMFLAPPAVPVMTTFCLTMSLARLRLSNIFGINPSAILSAGKVTTCCFDKTGTLTETHLDFSEFILSEEGKFSEPKKIEEAQSKNQLSNKLFATCQSITKNPNGEILGDPLDIKMFEASGYQLVEAGNKNTIAEYQDIKLEILYTNPFSSNDQCMSVIIKDSTFDYQKCLVFVKGSPEKIRSVSKPETIPQDFEQVLRKFTMHGLRVLAMGYRTLPIDTYQTLKREQMESELNFMGLMVFKNLLKHDTADVLTRLRKANFRVKMISGDNPLTCVQTGKQASIVAEDSKFIILEQSIDRKLIVSELHDEQIIESDRFDLMNGEISLSEWVKNCPFFVDKEIIIHGTALETLYNQNDNIEILKLIQKTSLFGRCRPEHKAMVIKSIKKLGVVCAMVGDGANDCPAIKAADLGISFSTADGSISAPFSALSPSISCIEKIILEGKSTTQNSIEALRYYTCTGVYKVVLNLILIFEKCWMSQSQNLFSSYILGTIIFNLFFGLNGPVENITIEYPNDNLLNPWYILTFMVHTFIGSLGFIILYVILINQDFYIKANIEGDKLGDKSYASTVLLNYSYILAISTLVAMYFSRPFKQPIYKNILLVLILSAKLIYCIVMIIEPTLSMKELKEVDYDPWFASIVFAVWIILFLIQFPIETWLQNKYLQNLVKYLKERGY